MGWLKWALDEIRRRVDSAHAAVAVFLGGCFLALAAGAWGFAALAGAVVEGQLRQFDEMVMRWINARASEGLDELALEVTVLGDLSVIAVLLLVSSALLWVSHHRYSVLLLWVGIAGSGPLIFVLKAAFDRERPQVFEWRGHYTVESASFPSGHALGSLVAYVLLAYLIVRLQASRPLRYTTMGFTALVVVAIGLTRIYLGVHYPSDVLAGYAFGLAWVALCAVALEALRYFRTGRLWMSPRELSADPRA
ncbi:MAG: phosphatase PAP2 family protein [Gemmatimonadota bacterium]